MLSSRLKRALVVAAAVSAAASVVAGNVAFAQAARDTRVALAAKNGDGAAIRQLIAQQADVNAALGDGMTALHWAVLREDLAAARVLIDANADVNRTTRLGGITPLLLAATNGNAAMIDLLVKAGATPAPRRPTDRPRSCWRRRQAASTP